MSSFLLGGGKFFFQAAVLHVHHIAVVGLFFQFGEFFFGQRVVAEEGALADIIQITRMNEGFFRERGLFLHSGKFLLLFGEGLVGLGEVLLFLVNLGGQAVQPFLLPLNFELGDGQVFFGAAALAALYIGVPDIVHFGHWCGQRHRFLPKGIPPFKVHREVTGNEDALLRKCNNPL